MNSYENKFDIPQMEYFSNKNIYTGSVRDFNYRIDPCVGNGQMQVCLWHGAICYEKSEVVKTTDFALNAEGLQEMTTWLVKEYQQFAEK